MRHTFVLRVQELTKKGTFQSLFLELAKGVTCLVGKSGAGKSTLINILRDAPKKTICLEKDHHIIAPPYTVELVPHFTIFENIIHFFVRHVAEKDLLKIKKQDFSKIFRKFSLNYVLELYPYQLDIREMHTALLICLLTLPKNYVIVLDEPLIKIRDKNLSNKILSAFIEVVKEQDKALVFSTNTPEEMLLADTAVLLDAKTQGVKRIFDNFSEKDLKTLYKEIYETKCKS